MGFIEGAGLLVVHLLYVLWDALVVFLSQVKRQPQPLDVERKKLPSHLALVIADAADSLQDEDAVVESICEAVRCCSVVGIANVSVYDRVGVSYKCAERVKTRLMDTFRLMSTDTDCSSESDLEYPLTPPASDVSVSRPLSPQDCFEDKPAVLALHLRKYDTILHCKPKEHKPFVKRRHSIGKSKDVCESEYPPTEIRLSILAYDASKPALASVARSFARHTVNDVQAWEAKTQDSTNFIEVVDCALRDLTHLSPPDLMIVHSLKPSKLQHSVLELYGFPPWSMRLTEIYHEYGSAPQWSRPRKDSLVGDVAILSEETLRRALDGFASAEMRLGK